MPMSASETVHCLCACRSKPDAVKNDLSSDAAQVAAETETSQPLVTDDLAVSESTAYSTEYAGLTDVEFDDQTGNTSVVSDILALPVL